MENWCCGYSAIRHHQDDGRDRTRLDQCVGGLVRAGPVHPVPFAARSTVEEIHHRVAHRGEPRIIVAGREIDTIAERAAERGTGNRGIEHLSIGECDEIHSAERLGRRGSYLPAPLRERMEQPLFHRPALEWVLTVGEETVPTRGVAIAQRCQSDQQDAPEDEPPTRRPLPNPPVRESW